MAVDPIKGYLFLTLEDKIIMYVFTVDLGVERMNPTIKLSHTSMYQAYVDKHKIEAITVDMD